ncbi:PAS domain S-box protein [Bacteroidota bacterium]
MIEPKSYPRKGKIHWFIAISGGISLVIGAVALIGRLVTLPLLASIFPEYIPMASATAILSAGYGFIFLTGLYNTSNRIYKTGLTVIFSLLTLYALLKFLEYFLNVTLTLDAILFPNTEMLGNFPTNRSSPITGLLFFLCGIATLVKLTGPATAKINNVVGGFGLAVAFTGFTGLIGYLFGTPFLYGGDIIPLSLLTTIAFLLLGSGLIAMSGSESIFLSRFAGSSASAQLLRAILPIIVVAMLADDMLDIALSNILSINQAVISAVLALLLISVTVFVVARVSHLIFRKADRAEEEKRRVQENLNAQNKFLHTIIESLPHPFYVINPDDYTVLLGNSASGWSSEATHTTCYGLTHGADMPCSVDAQHTCPIGEIRRTLKPVVAEHIHFDAAGSPKKVEVHAYPILDEAGNLSQVIEYSLDITERKRMEESLRESEERYRLIVENQGEGIGFVDNDEQFTFANPAAERIFGVAPGKLVGRNLKDFLSPDELTRVLEETKKRAKAVQSSYELEIITHANQVRHVVVTATPQITETGEFTGTFGVFRDITASKKVQADLKQSEEQFRTLTETSTDAIVSIDRDGRILFFNNAAERIFGYSSKEIYLKTIDLLIPERYGRIFMRGIAKYLETGISTILGEIFEFRGRRQNGDLFPLELSLSEVKIGEDINFIGIIRDISDRKKIEEKLKQYTLALQESNNTKDKFFSIIAHDLKSPFNAILGLTNALIHDYPSLEKQQVEGLLRTIRTSSEKAFELLDNLLVWANTQTGKITFTPEPLPVGTLVNDTVALMESTATNKRIRINVAMIADVIVIADQQMIRTVLRNLLSNAIKFTPFGGNITVLVKPGEKVCTLSVKDSGVGISKADISKLFRIDSKHTTRGTADEKGTGLGLILCKEFVEKYGGKIWVESEEGRGSAFSFTLPVDG